ncbi:hypothetical protein EVAR_61927_1 [Eumeta japonica]|uniref:Uncharacterized protein n=1 Tax=Eumeta variegata TaxID=151549 RepID=A0A4C1ZK76_EUMVA|nr:hypothetical protein EVAR_61927_1 [Eumeta japonica]
MDICNSEGVINVFPVFWVEIKYLTEKEEGINLQPPLPHSRGRLWCKGGKILLREAWPCTFAFRMRWRSFADLPHPFFCGCSCETQDYVASCPGVFSSGIRPRRSSGDGPISVVQTCRISEPVGYQEELSVGTPTSSLTVTAVSGSGGEVVGRRSVRTYRTLVCHSTSCPRNLSFGGMVRCWMVSVATVFLTFTATRHLSSQSGNRSRTLWSLAIARSARRDDARYALSSAYSASTTSSSQSCSWSVRVGMSSVYTPYKHGDRQLPCGTPTWMGRES